MFMADTELDNKFLKNAILKGLDLFSKQTKAEETRQFLKSMGMSQEQLEAAWEYIQEEGAKNLSDTLIKQCLEKRKQGIKEKTMTQNLRGIGISDADIKIIFDVVADVEKEQQEEEKQKIAVQAIPAPQNRANRQALQQTPSQESITKKIEKPGHNYVFLVIIATLAAAFWLMFKK